MPRAVETDVVTFEERRRVVIHAAARRRLDFSGIADAVRGLSAVIDAKSNASVELVDARLESRVARATPHSTSRSSRSAIGPPCASTCLRLPPSRRPWPRCGASDALETSLELADPGVDAAIHAGRRVAYAAPAMKERLAALDGTGARVAAVDDRAGLGRGGAARRPGRRQPPRCIVMSKTKRSER